MFENNGKKAIEVQNLKYVYTQQELVELGREYAYANRQLAELEDQKKSVVAQLNSQISAQKEMVNILTSKVGNGYRYDNVECLIDFHTPEKGTKTLTRTDIDESRKEMELSFTEKMTEKDWMLWSDKYSEIECDVEYHTPDIDRKTLVQRTTGHKFIEQMTAIDIDNWETGCNIAFHRPKEGFKTLTHKETGVQIERKMNQADIDGTQTKLFDLEPVEADDFDDLEINVETDED